VLIDRGDHVDRLRFTLRAARQKQSENELPTAFTEAVRLPSQEQSHT
jgi:hypothetical protein